MAEKTKDSNIHDLSNEFKKLKRDAKLFVAGGIGAAAAVAGSNVKIAHASAYAANFFYSAGTTGLFVEFTVMACGALIYVAYISYSEYRKLKSQEKHKEE